MVQQESYDETLRRYGARARYQELMQEIAELSRRFPEIALDPPPVRPAVPSLPAAAENGTGKVDGRTLRGTAGTLDKPARVASISQRMRDLHEARSHKRKGGRRKKARPAPEAPTPAVGSGLVVELPKDYSIGEAVQLVLSRHTGLTAREIGEVLIRSGFTNTKSSDIPQLVSVTLPRLVRDHKSVRGWATERGKAWELTPTGVRRQAQSDARLAGTTLPHDGGGNPAEA